MEHVPARSSEAAKGRGDTVTDTANRSDVIFGYFAVLRVVFSPMVPVGRCPLPAELANATTSE